MEYMEPNMELIEFNVLEDIIRTSDPGLTPGEGNEDEGKYDETFGGL